MSNDTRDGRTPAPSTPFDPRRDGPPADSLPSVLRPPVEAGEVGVLGRFRLQKQIGRGGMGVVFQAIDTRLGRPVALKMMRPEIVATERARQRFLLEARAAAQVVHDNVVNILDIDEVDGVPFISMPFLKGRSLEDHLRKTPRPSVSQVLRIAREMALGLAAAHELGVVHRDIKPANVWLEAPKGRVKILDFGLAKLLQEDSDGQLTSTGAFLGTPLYVAPEQAQTGPIDHRADLYSLGSVLYRMLSGKAPFERPGGLLTVLSALAIEQPKPIRETNPDVPEGLATLIHKLLEKEPARRPRSAREVAESLRQLMLARVSGEVPIEPQTEEKPSVDQETTTAEETPRRTVHRKRRSKTQRIQDEVDYEVLDDEIDDEVLDEFDTTARGGFVRRNRLPIVGTIGFVSLMYLLGDFRDSVKIKGSVSQYVLVVLSTALALWFVLRRDRPSHRSGLRRFFETWFQCAAVAGCLGFMGGAFNDIPRSTSYSADPGYLIGGVFGLVIGLFAGLFAACSEWWLRWIRRRAAILSLDDND